jgi:signal peptidase
MRARLKLAVDLALAGLILIVGATFVLGRLVPATGSTTIIVTGGSMEPAIPRGAAIVADPIDPSRLGVGDVVTFRVDEGRARVTHRITRSVILDGRLWFETKGDASAAPDPVLIPASAVTGVVTVVIPNAGSLIALLDRPAGVALVLGLVGLMLVAGMALQPGGSGRRQRLAAPAARAVEA